MTALDTVPAYCEIASPEVIPLAVNVTNQLGQGDTVQTASSTITDINSGQDLSGMMLFGNPTIQGNTITQVIKNAVAGAQYYWVCTFTIGANKVLSFRMRLIADY